MNEKRTVVLAGRKKKEKTPTSVNVTLDTTKIAGGVKSRGKNKGQLKDVKDATPATKKKNLSKTKADGKTPCKRKVGGRGRPCGTKNKDGVRTGPKPGAKAAKKAEAEKAAKNKTKAEKSAATKANKKRVKETSFNPPLPANKGAATRARNKAAKAAGVK